MLTNQRLDELDRQAAETQTPGQYPMLDGLISGLDTIARSIPELTAEIRRLWAELERGDQAGMVELLAESRRITWMS